VQPPLILAGRSFALDRWPVRRGDRLRAWDTADQYLLQTLLAPPGSGGATAATAGRVLVIEDDFGALAIPLAWHGAEVVSWHDSHLAALALAHNLERQGLPPGAVDFVAADTEPVGTFDAVVARFPKALAAWEDLLARLRPHLRPETRVLAGGMIRHTPRRAYTLLESAVGPVTTSLGWKKARVAEATVDPARPGLDPVPDTTYELPGHGLVLHTAPGVFARERLDGGTRLLLGRLPRDRTGRLADLGCGNGAVALALALANPAAAVLGTDASFRAVACARTNAARAGLAPPRLEFAVADGLAELPAGTLAAVACNPPFHQDRAVGDALAWGMFTQAHRALVAGGELRVVGNRSLGHGRRLQRIFGAVERLAQDDRFEVLLAVRR